MEQTSDPRNNGVSSRKSNTSHSNFLQFLRHIKKFSVLSAPFRAGAGAYSAGTASAV